MAPVTVSVTDDDGGIGTASITLVINDIATKVTGGGFFTPSYGKTFFGFVAKRLPNGALQGELEVSTHKNGRFHGDTVSTLTVSGKKATWTGTGKFNGKPGYTYTVAVVDNSNNAKNKARDTITITIRKGVQVVFKAGGDVKGGNIVVHS